VIKNHPGICLEGLKNATETLSQGNWCLFEYEAKGVLHATSRAVLSAGFFIDDYS
jgi:hypothetical protein